MMHQTACSRKETLGGQRAAALALVVTAVLGASACASTSSTSGLTTNGDPDVTCPEHLCGQNDPRLNDYRFAALNLDGKRNPNTSAALIGFKDKAGRPLRIDVTPEGEIVGTYGDGSTLAGVGLIGSHLVVETIGQHGKPGKPDKRAGDKREIWYIEIKGTAPASHLSNEARMLTRYWLSFGPPENPRRKPLCKGEDRADLGALLIRDEIYNPSTLAIEVPFGDPAAHNWINLACHDHALEKMKRMSYEPGRAKDDPYYTTPAERDATIKMITAAYCEDDSGKSVSFTRPGTDLFWQNDAGWMVEGAPPTQGAHASDPLEAYWDQNGAICLNQRRIKKTRGDSVSSCWRKLPRCKGTPTRWEWVTQVPDLQTAASAR